jgi:hypothetical protein
LLALAVNPHLERVDLLAAALLMLAIGSAARLLRSARLDANRDGEIITLIVTWGGQTSIASCLWCRRERINRVGDFFQLDAGRRRAGVL